jgi:hypothetical protein
LKELFDGMSDEDKKSISLLSAKLKTVIEVKSKLEGKVNGLESLKRE